MSSFARRVAGKPVPTFPDHALAGRRPLERSANFSGRLVAILVQFLESLLQRPEVHGAFRWPFPVNVESVRGRWTGRRGLQEGQRLLQRCVVTVVGRHLHASQIANRPDSIRPNFSVVARWCSDSATYSVLFGCPAGVDLVAKDGQRWQPSYSYGPPFPRIRCNRQPTSPILSFVRCSSAIVRYVSTAFRSRLDAALRNLRGRHDQDRKAAPDRIAPARLRLQVPRLQPDNVGRAGAAGRSDPSPGRVNAAGRGASQVRSHLKTPIPTTARVSSWPCCM